MSLKRYLIVPIAPTIILGEWLSNSISLSKIIKEQSIKDLIYHDEERILFDIIIKIVHILILAH
jgi:phosphatidylinositol kinase/protein kinase (PI-3  family)